MEIRHRRKPIIISTTKEKDKLSLSSSQTKEILEMQLYPEEEPIYRPPRFEDRQLEYYREMENQKAHHPVMQSIRSLPSPMLLGIERRGRELFAPEERPQYAAPQYVRRVTVRSRNIFGNTLYDSLREAGELASVIFGEIQRKQFIATEDLRRNIILNSLKYEGIERTEKHSFSEISNKVIDSEKQIVDTFLDLKLPQREIDSQLTPFFTKLKQIVDVLKDETDIGQLITSSEERKRTAAIDWFINYPQYTRMSDLADFISKYIIKRQQLNESADRYFSLVNRFLRDSGKEMTYDYRDRLIVKVKGSEPISITSLSSGESQLVVIITHLMFNPAAQQENVFIVDEPELSLHVGWQDLFVNTIREANPSLQLILATHSPSIILEQTDNCVDLSK